MTSLAQIVLETRSERGLEARLLDPDVLALMIPMVVVITIGAVIITKMIIRHRERMALIESGLHPDAPGDDSAHRGR